MTLLVTFALYLLIFTRFLRWLSLWQQKEYRLDRLLAYLKTPPGQLELVSIVAIPRSPATFKRPHLTLKAILILTFAAVIFFATLPTSLPQIFLHYLLIPVYILIATLPAWLATVLTTYYYRYQSLSLLRRHSPTIIGITGSYGKTTTKLLLAHILSRKHQVWFPPKSFNTPLSLPKAFSQTYTGQPFVIVEFAAYRRGEITHLTRIFPPHQAIITGLNQQHLATFGSFANLIQAKSELPAALPPGSPLYINNQDKQVASLARSFKNLSIKRPVGTLLKRPRLSPQGRLSFILGSFRVTTKLLGLHYLTNLELALSLAKANGLTISQLKSSLTSFSPGPEFITRSTTNSGLTIIHDLKTSNPDGFSAALDLAKSIKAPKKLIITSGIIDLGSDSAKIHTSLAKQTSSVFDFFVHTGPTGADQFSKSTTYQYHSLSQPTAIISLINRYLSAGDLVLLEGKLLPGLSNAINQL